MNRKVFEPKGDQSYRALPQNLGGSGSTSDAEAAKKLGLLTTSSDYPKLDSNKKLSISAVARGVCSLVPLIPGPFLTNQAYVFRALGMGESLTVSVTGAGALTATVLNGGYLSLRATAAGSFSVTVNNQTFPVTFVANVMKAPTFELIDPVITVPKGQTVYLRPLLEEQVKSWGVGSKNIEVETTIGSTPTVTTGYGALYLTSDSDTWARAIRVRWIDVNGVVSPWSEVKNLLTGQNYQNHNPTSGKMFSYVGERLCVLNPDLKSVSTYIPGSSANTFEKTINAPTGYTIGPMLCDGGDDVLIVGLTKATQSSNALQNEQHPAELACVDLNGSDTVFTVLPGIWKDGLNFKAQLAWFVVGKNGNYIIGSFIKNNQVGSGIFIYKRIAKGVYNLHAVHENAQGVFTRYMDIDSDGRTVAMSKTLDSSFQVTSNWIDIVSLDENGAVLSTKTLATGTFTAVGVAFGFKPKEIVVTESDFGQNPMRFSRYNYQTNTLIESIPSSITSMSVAVAASQIQSALNRKLFGVVTLGYLMFIYEYSEIVDKLVLRTHFSAQSDGYLVQRVTFNSTNTRMVFYEVRLSDGASYRYFEKPVPDDATGNFLSPDQYLTVDLTTDYPQASWYIVQGSQSPYDFGASPEPFPDEFITVAIATNITTKVRYAVVLTFDKVSGVLLRKKSVQIGNAGTPTSGLATRPEVSVSMTKTFITLRFNEWIAGVGGRICRMYIIGRNGNEWRLEMTPATYDPSSEYAHARRLTPVGSTNFALCSLESSSVTGKGSLAVYQRNVSTGVWTKVSSYENSAPYKSSFCVTTDVSRFPDSGNEYTISCIDPYYGGSSPNWQPALLLFKLNASTGALRIWSFVGTLKAQIPSADQTSGLYMAMSRNGKYLLLGSYTGAPTIIVNIETFGGFKFYSTETMSFSLGGSRDPRFGGTITDGALASAIPGVESDEIFHIIAKKVDVSSDPIIGTSTNGGVMVWKFRYNPVANNCDVIRRNEIGYGTMMYENGSGSAADGAGIYAIASGDDNFYGVHNGYQGKYSLSRYKIPKI